MAVPYESRSSLSLSEWVDDFAKIDSVPVAMANLVVGHGEAYAQPNGGEFGKVAVAWLQWQPQGD